jgi:tetratricopeptide (TPR) repeat protein
MRKFIFISASILILLSSLPISSQTVSKDTTHSEILKQPASNYETAMENAKRSIDLANLMIQLLILAVAVMAGLGIFSYVRTGQIRKQVEVESEEIRKLKENIKDDFRKEFEKTVNLRRAIEKTKTQAEIYVKDIKGIRGTVEKIATNVGKAGKEIDEKKRSVEQSKTQVSAISYFTEGDGLYYEQKHEQAIEKYKKATELKPDYAEAYSNWGAALRKLGRHEEAIEKCKWATDLKPNYANGWYNIACIHSLQKNKAEALKNLKKAIELDPSYKEEAKKDKDFKNLWEDEDFKKLVE